MPTLFPAFASAKLMKHKGKAYDQTLFYAIIIHNENGHECQRLAARTSGLSNDIDVDPKLSASYDMDSDLMFQQAMGGRQFGIIPMEKKKSYLGSRVVRFLLCFRVVTKVQCSRL